MRLEDKVAIITGAKSGIGFATALRFATEGAKVVVADIMDAQQQVREITKQEGEAIFVQVDVSNDAQVSLLIEKTVATYGCIDVLVNNAGIELTKNVTETTEAEWDHLMGVNPKGLFLCAKAVIPVMQRNRGGNIVNVASELGLVGDSELVAYCASKGGVVQLTKAMAINHADDGIRVNCVCPGSVSTPLLERMIESCSNPEDKRRRIMGNIPLKRFAQPVEIANVILFLASDESSFMTGSVVTVDGGIPPTNYNENYYGLL